MPRKSKKSTAKKGVEKGKRKEEKAEVKASEEIEEVEDSTDEDTGDSGGTGDDQSGSSARDEEPKEARQEKAKVREKQKLKRGLFSLSFKKKKEEGFEIAPPKGKIGKFFSSLNNMGMGKQRVMLIQSMGMMVNAGLPLIDTLQTLQMEVKNKQLRKIIRRIGGAVESGIPLWRAMENQYLFTPYEIALIRIGEEAGNLARNLEYLAEQQEKDHALRAKVKMAMIYPTIVMTLMFIIVMGLGMFVLPNLIQVLVSMNAELPATTRAVIYVTNLFSKHGATAIPSMIGGFIVLALLSKYTRFRVVSQWFVFKIPGVGALAKQATIARFGVILGGLLRAGVPLVEALRSLEDVTHVAAYKKFYGRLLEHITQGDTFSKSFTEIKNSRKLIPASMQQLVITGEQSGTLADTLVKIADIYEKKASETAEKLPVILEPMLLLFIGGLVGTIAFSIITPIYSVVGNVGR